MESNHSLRIESPTFLPLNYTVIAESKRFELLKHHKGAYRFSRPTPSTTRPTLLFEYSSEIGPELDVLQTPAFPLRQLYIVPTRGFEPQPPDSKSGDTTVSPSGNIIN